MTALRLLLAGLLGSLGLVALTPTTSFACSCAMGGPKQYAAWADAVFAGTLTEVTPPSAGAAMSSTDPVGYAFDVDLVLRGEVGASVTIQSASLGASCGLEGMRVGERYLVFAQAARDDRLEANLCGGTQPARDGLIAKVEQVTGPGQPPMAAPVPEIELDAGEDLDWMTQVLRAVRALLDLL